MKFVSDFAPARSAQSHAARIAEEMQESDRKAYCNLHRDIGKTQSDSG